jgi:hypothetical protein
MANQIPAATSSRRRPAQDAGNPVSVSQPIGVAAYLHDIGKSLKELTTISERIAIAVERQNQSTKSLPCLALSFEEAAKSMGKDVGAIKYLVRTGQLLAVPLYDQKGYIILFEDFVAFLKKRREAMEKKINGTPTC